MHFFSSFFAGLSFGRGRVGLGIRSVRVGLGWAGSGRVGKKGGAVSWQGGYGRAWLLYVFYGSSG